MKKKIFSLIVVLCGLTFLLTGCGKQEKESDVKADLNKVINTFYEEKESQGLQRTMGVDDLQKYAESYSHYIVMNVGSKEFTSKPNEPKDLILYIDKINPIQTSIDDTDRYFLVYDKDSKNYYSTKCIWDEKTERPIFSEVKKLK